MNPEKDYKKGGSRLSRLEKPAGGKKPKPQLTPRQKVLRVLYVAVFVVAALTVAVFAASRLIFVKPNVSVVERPNHSKAINEGDADIGESPDIAENGRKEDFFTFLVIGRDTGGGGNADTILLASYDVTNQKLNVMSVPRDTMVNVSWDIKRINSVYNFSGGGDKGVEALNSEISQLVGFVPDFQVVVEWNAVGDLVEAIDGVWFDVPRNMDYDDPTQDLHIHIAKGYQKLSGDDAMKVVRFRDGNNNSGYVNGDLGRIETQQAFLKAVVEQCLQFKNVDNIGKLSKVFTDNVSTNLTVNNLAWFAQQAIFGGLKMDNVNFVTMPCSNKGVWSRSFAGKSYQFQSFVVPKTGELVDLVNECFNPYLKDLDQSELDIMYVNADGTIGSSTGHLEDKQHNIRWLEYKNRPKESEKPEESEVPEESGALEPSESPEEYQPGTTQPPEQTAGLPDGEAIINPATPSPSVSPSLTPQEPAQNAPVFTPPAVATPDPADTDTVSDSGEEPPDWIPIYE